MAENSAISPASAYPIQMDLQAPLKVARWRVIGNPVMAIPHFIVLYVMLLVLEVLAVVSWFAILFTGNIPPGIFNLMAAIFRYQWRVYSFALWMREPYPAFDFTASAADTGTDAASFSVVYPQRLSRLLIFVKWLLIIPALVALLVVGIVAYVVIVIGWLAVLFTGKWPEAMRSFVIGVLRWNLRATAYLYLMTDAYPPFSLST